ncbi:cytochrome c-type biogenesis protein CcmH [Acetobacteraceae bacterium]|nr:cytochrome c-type biogenesis protein CcmH [Acetobacteraceae bacterium]
MKFFAYVLFSLCFSASYFGMPLLAFAVESPQEKLASIEQENLAERIGEQLRCPVCQNANIEESNAPLAKTLRTVIRKQVLEGKNETEILEWMQRRYGDFIFLTPPLSRYSLLLWSTPFLSCLIGACLLLLRRKNLSRSQETK